MTREEFINRKAAGYGIRMRDSFVAEGLSRQQAENAAALMQTAYADGMKTADENPQNPWTATTEELPKETLILHLKDQDDDNLKIASYDPFWNLWRINHICCYDIDLRAIADRYMTVPKH